MNYILQIKGFWVLHDLHSFSAEEVGLYFHLLEISNKLNWLNPFKRNNSKVMADLGIRDRRTLDRYRNSLKIAGALDFKTKNGDGNVTYTIHDLSNYCTGFGTGNSTGYSTGSGIGTSTGDGIDKINKTKAKPNPSEANASGPAASTRKKKEATKQATTDDETPYWQKMVDGWFSFYRAGPGMGEDPTFDGQAPKSLKKICGWLQKRSELKDIEWTEAVAVDTLNRFLTFAYNLDWVKNNFLLHNLERQFDTIVNQNGKGASKSAGQQTASDYKQQLANELTGNSG